MYVKSKGKEGFNMKAKTWMLFKCICVVLLIFFLLINFGLVNNKYTNYGIYLFIISFLIALAFDLFDKIKK